VHLVRRGCPMHGLVFNDNEVTPSSSSFTRLGKELHCSARAIAPHRGPKLPGPLSHSVGLSIFLAHANSPIPLWISFILLSIDSTQVLNNRLLLLRPRYRSFTTITGSSYRRRGAWRNLRRPCLQRDLYPCPVWLRISHLGDFLSSCVTQSCEAQCIAQITKIATGIYIDLSVETCAIFRWTFTFCLTLISV